MAEVNGNYPLSSSGGSTTKSMDTNKTAQQSYPAPPAMQTWPTFKDLADSAPGKHASPLEVREFLNVAARWRGIEKFRTDQCYLTGRELHAWYKSDISRYLTNSCRVDAEVAGWMADDIDDVLEGYRRANSNEFSTSYGLYFVIGVFVFGIVDIVVNALKLLCHVFFNFIHAEPGQT